MNVPIDIHTNKLLEWLISRRHCNKDWQSYIINIREKINNAIQDMPVHNGIVKLLSGTYINYFHVLQIIDILKETEADTKNLFGRYGSQRMKDWQEIAKLYERDNIYLAEGAQMFIRNVNYEIPSIRKQMAKLEQMQAECEKREKEYAKAEKIIRSDFSASCKNLGIKGENIKRELIEMLAELPGLYRAAAESAKNVASGVQLYKEFIEYTSSKETTDSCLPLLEFIIQHGNTTTYEWTYGEAPVTMEEPALNIALDVEAIDLSGVAVGGDNDNEEIDFGAADDDIDWGTNYADVSDPSDQIDFNISLEESGIVVEDAGIEGGVARGNDALTLLDNPKTRGRFVDELMELESFLKMRLYELSNTSAMDALSQMQATGSAAIQLQTPESVAGLLSSVQGTIASVTNNRIQHLHSVKHSPRYVDYLTESLEQKLNAAEKTATQQKLVIQRQQDAFGQIVSFKPILSNIVEKTKELQVQIQNDISKRYTDRPVNLLGGVH